MNDPAEDFVVLLTPEGRGAVASLAVEGPNTSALIGRHLHRSEQAAPLSKASPVGRIFYGRWRSAEDSSADLGEDVVACRGSETKWEIHCHGGRAAIERIRADLQHAGCRSLTWREWVSQQETDPIRVAAVSLLADARTERTAAILLDQHDGAWQRALAEIRERLVSAQTAPAAAQIRSLLRLASLGAHLVQPWRVVVAGPPNVGKSSLINALVGYQRAIVHDQPGTTRDAVSVQLAVDGWPVELVDTAGLRTSDDPLETAGIARAMEELRAADAALLVFDATEPWAPALATLARLRPDAIVVHNKSDLLADADSAAAKVDVQTSATTCAGLDLLLRRMIEQLVPEPPAKGSAVPLLPTQIEQLRLALASLEAGENCSAIAILS